MIHIFYVGLEEPTAEAKKISDKKGGIIRKWLKRKRKVKEGKAEALPVFEVLRKFPFAQGEIRLLYCLLPYRFLEEAEYQERHRRWLLRIEETLKQTESVFGVLCLHALITDESISTYIPFAERVPAELFAACFYEVRKKRQEDKISISLPSDCGRYAAEQMIMIVGPYLSKINTIALIGEENAVNGLLEEFFFEEYGIVMIYRKYPLQDTVWIDLGEKSSPVLRKYVKDNGIYHINEALVRKFLDTAAKNGYNNKVN